MITETITLNYPIEHSGVRITEVTLRRPKGRDIRRSEQLALTNKGGDYARTLSMIADLAELAPDAIDNMDASDIERISEVVKGFLGV
jgi:hypothetical protein